MTRILERRDPEEVSDLQLAAHASDFVLAGSETTATALSTITYYLLKTPPVMHTLREEIRGAFQRYEDITDRSTQRLPYLRAVILEGMRMYPPLPFPLPRVVPEGGDMVDGHMLPGGVRTAKKYNFFPALYRSLWFLSDYKSTGQRRQRITFLHTDNRLDQSLGGVFGPP
jgi:hypothetical protein